MKNLLLLTLEKVSIIFNIFKIKNNRIFTEVNWGKGYGESPKEIYENILSQNLDFELIWAVNDIENCNVPEKVRAVRRKSLKYFYYLSTSKFILSNVRIKWYFKKKSGQIYFQLWHGFGPKKIESHADISLSNEYKRMAKIDSKAIDFLVSPSKTFTEKVAPSFWYDGQILEIGLPRNDKMTCKINTLSKLNVEKYYKKKFSKKTVLYAPTFRKNSGLEAYDIDLIRLKNELDLVYNSDFDVLLRLHPNVSHLSNQILSENSEIIDVSDYPDMNELLSMSDVLVTDYSSAMTDFILSDRLCVIYASDINEYNQDRGFYFPLNSVTGFVCENNDDINKYFDNFSMSEYQENISNFKKKHGLVEPGKSSEKIVNLMKSILEGTENNNKNEKVRK